MKHKIVFFLVSFIIIIIISIKVYAKIGFKWLELTRGSKYACDHLIEGECPLKANKRITYRNQVSLPSFLPAGLQGTVKIRAHSEDNKTVSCTLIKAIISK